MGQSILSSKGNYMSKKNETFEGVMDFRFPINDFHTHYLKKLNIAGR
jgi:hypothetical protein